MVVGIGVFNNYYDYDKATSNFFTNLLLLNPVKLEEELIKMASNDGALILHNDYITKNYVYDKIMKIGVPDIVLIHEEDLKLLNSTEVNEKVIDIRITTNEDGLKEVEGVV